MPISTVLIGLAAAAGSLTVPATASADAPTCFGKPVTVNMKLGEQPTPGQDVILGTDGDDFINLGFGGDTVCSLGGDDEIGVHITHWPEPDFSLPDVINAGPGDDNVSAGAGENIVFGGEGNDRLDGRWDHDELHGGPGDDAVGEFHGERYDDLPVGDLLDGGRGHDLCWAWPPFDRVLQPDEFVSCEELDDGVIDPTPTPTPTPTRAPIVLTSKAIAFLPGYPRHANRCVTRAEYRSVRHGMSRAQVASRFGTRGTLSSRIVSGKFESITRVYRGCFPGFVVIDFDNFG